MTKLKLTVNQDYNHIRLSFRDFCGMCEFMDKALQSGEGISFNIEPEEEEKAEEEKAPEEEGSAGEEEMTDDGWTEDF